MIESLAAVIPEPATGQGPPASADDEEHPMRVLARRIAVEPGFWTAERRRQVESIFDGLAPTWPHDDFPGIIGLLDDAVARGVVRAPEADRRRLLDLGGGNGRAVETLRRHAPDVLLVDLSAEMLANTRGTAAPRVQADASRLPLLDGSVDIIVLANMFLFPEELDRVLDDHGIVIWLNSFGPRTPIHLSADEVDGSLPGDWTGVASTAGIGSWSVHWRRPCPGD